MHITAQAFWLPKAGNTTEEYEDAFWPNQQIDQYAEAFSFAVADGATETSFSGLWARLLVQAYCKRKLSITSLFKWIPELQKKWLENVNEKPLPWFAEEKLRRGAFSSILGLTIKDASHTKGPAKWQALAIGDSCLFHMRGDILLTSFPLSHSEQFNSRPALISSNPSYNSELHDITFRKEGTFQEGDSFYLMTDALACWFLGALELNEKPWEFLWDWGTSGAAISFPDWIMELRKARLMRNDDVTLIRVEIT